MRRVAQHSKYGEGIPGRAMGCNHYVIFSVKGEIRLRNYRAAGARQIGNQKVDVLSNRLARFVVGTNLCRRGKTTAFLDNFRVANDTPRIGSITQGADLCSLRSACLQQWCKRVSGIVSAILASLYTQTADDAGTCVGNGAVRFGRKQMGWTMQFCRGLRLEIRASVPNGARIFVLLRNARGEA